ncbi:MAG: HEAT repeat domain-containing protein [Planctomycetota bacterium]
MCKCAQRWGVAVAFLVAVAVGLAATVRAEDAPEQVILDSFGEGIRLYEIGEYDAAKEKFAAILAMQPGMQVALKMHDTAELAQFIEMRKKDELREEVDRILDLMLRAARQRKRVVTDADKLIEDLKSPDLPVYGKARVQLAGHCPYAVPYVVPLLAYEVPEQQVVVSRAVSLLAELQRDACLPLIQVLGSVDEPLLRTRVADVLGQIGDPRAVPALMAALEDPAASSQVREAAAAALENITDQPLAELGSAPRQYEVLARHYLSENKAVAGYTYGLTADIWEWVPEAEDLSGSIAYEEVPTYLYYQRMATEVALDGLQAAPGDRHLQAVLGAALVRQLALCEFFQSEDVRLGGMELEAEVKQDAAERAAEFNVQVPVALRILQAPVVAAALQLTLLEGDGRASVYLTKTLGDKLGAASAGSLDAATAEALVAALDSGDKDVRYSAAIVLVQAAPTGQDLPAARVMDVMAAALKAAADQNALVVMDNFQIRNQFVHLLRSEGVATVECEIIEGRIEESLSLEPSIDIVFLSAGVPAERFARIMRLLSSDPRTRTVPLYVVAIPVPRGPELAEYEGVEEFLATSDLRVAKLRPILESQVFAESRSLFADEEAALVLKGARAVSGVYPPQSEYPLEVLEPSLLGALSGYGEEVSAAAVAALAEVGSQLSVEPLSGLVSGEASLELKVAACRALAAVMKRTGAGAPEAVVAVLSDALGTDQQVLRQAAAEALSAAGMDEPEVLSLLRAEALGEK